MRVYQGNEKVKRKVNLACLHIDVHSHIQIDRMNFINPSVYKEEKDAWYLWYLITRIFPRGKSVNVCTDLKMLICNPAHQKNAF
jgi:hypothetical protein